MGSDLINQAKKTIKETFFLNIASITETGKPWNTPVYFSFDNSYNFYWYSPFQSQHSANIRINAKVFLTIYTAAETGFGVYIEAEAIELNNEKEIVYAMSVFGRKIYSLPCKDSNDFLGNSPLRLYKATPIKTFVSSPKTAEKFRELWVDKRIEINLI